jgi:hypothetical protein
MVTPTGIRDGDPGALAALVERRANAVLAYCEAVCPPGIAPRAAAEAFARFRAAVAAAEDPRALDPERLLIGATRHAAASLTSVAGGDAPRGGLRRRLGRGTGASETCAHVPDLLAARADGALGEADQQRLSRHLERHDECRTLAAAQERAEARYAAPPERTVPIGALSEIMAALATAAPITAAPGARLPFGAVETPEASEDALDAPQAFVDGGPDAGAEHEIAPADAVPAPFTADDDHGFEPADEPGEPVAPDDPLAADTEAYVTHDEPVVDDAETHGADDAGAREADDDDGHGAAAGVAAIAGATALGATAEPSPSTALPRPRRTEDVDAAPREHSVLLRYVLPAAMICAAAFGAMEVAGVFASDPPPKAPAAATATAGTPAAPPADAAPVTPSGPTDAEKAQAAARRQAKKAAAAKAARERRVRAARRRARLAAAAAAKRAAQAAPAAAAPAPARAAAPATVQPSPGSSTTSNTKTGTQPATVTKPSSGGTSGLPSDTTTTTEPAAPGVFDPTPAAP